ncbi:MAG: hypothetical protein ABWX65_04495 [Mycetocola sp.]
MLLTVLTGCASGEPTAETTTEPPAVPDGVSVEILQGRTDYSSDTLVIRVVNDSRSDLDLTRATLAVPGFGEAVWERGTTVGAGLTVDLRAPVPSPDCTERPGTPEVTLTVADDASAVLTATDPLGTLNRLHATACVAVLVDVIVRISVGELTVGGDGDASVALLPLTLTPTGAEGSVEFGDISSTPLLRPAVDVGDDVAAENWPVSITIDAESDPEDVVLRIVPARCDPHAIAEDKVGTVLVMAVTLVDGTTADYRLTLPDENREELLDFVREHCGMA